MQDRFVTTCATVGMQALQFENFHEDDSGHMDDVSNAGDSSARADIQLVKWLEKEIVTQISCRGVVSVKKFQKRCNCCQMGYN